MNHLDSTMLAIEDFPQVFFDNAIVEASQELTKTFHEPKKHELSPVMKGDRLWEHAVYFTVSNHVVRRDSKDGLFKCWYEDLLDHNARDCLVQARMCYAESSDGLRWEKPALDIVVEDGRRTNVVLGGTPGVESAHSTSVIEDPFSTEDAERYRAVFSHYPPFEGEIRVASSPDGIRWLVRDERPSFGSLGPKMGDVNILHYDHWSHCFVSTCRQWYQCHPCLNPRNPVGPTNPGPRYPYDFSKQNRRRIWQSESPDMIHWSEPYLVVCPDDDEDNIDDGFYGMTQYELGKVYLGFLNVFHRTSNEMDVQLAFSRDRKHWLRLNKRQPWLTLGPSGSWDEHMVMICSPPIEIGDELLIYYGGACGHHDYFIWGQREGLDHPEAKDPSLQQFGLGLARLRREGFVSFDAGTVREGLLITRPFLSQGTKLVVNARCGSGGYVKVEVVDHGDTLLPGRSREDCDLFTGDSTAHTVTWKGESALPVAHPEFGGSTVYPWKKQTPYRKVRFFMKNAELYSFRLC